MTEGDIVGILVVVVTVVVIDVRFLEDWLLSLMSTLVIGFGPQY
jgi:hypothetical protein